LAQDKMIMQNDMELEIDLLDIMKHLLRKWKTIFAAGLIGLIAAGFYAYAIATPVYEATAQIYVVNSSDSVLNLSDLQIGSYLTSDYQLVFKTWEVNQMVIENLQLPYTVGQLRNMLTVTNPSNTRALTITIASTSAKEAADIANEFARVARQYISDTMMTDMPTTLSKALEPTSPVSPQKTKMMILGLMVGLVLAAGVLVVLYMLDDKIKTASDLMKYTGALPLAVIPVTDKAADKKLKGR